MYSVPYFPSYTISQSTQSEHDMISTLAKPNSLPVCYKGPVTVEINLTRSDSQHISTYVFSVSCV